MPRSLSQQKPEHSLRKSKRARQEGARKATRIRIANALGKKVASNNVNVTVVLRDNEASARASEAESALEKCQSKLALSEQKLADTMQILNRLRGFEERSTAEDNIDAVQEEMDATNGTNKVRSTSTK